MVHSSRWVSSELSKMVERQMRNWELSHAQRRRDPEPVRQQICDFLCVSRAVGSCGDEIAAGIGRALHWPVFDRQLVQAMAGDDEVRARLYASMDERDLGWFEEIVRSLIPGDFHKNDYFHRLTETILFLSLQEPAVFVGRAADLILPRDRGLRVRIIGAPERCVRRFAEQHGLSLDKAKEEVTRIERERDVFVRHHFRMDAADSARYDVTFNEDRLSEDEIIDAIRWMIQLRNAAGR